MATLTIRSPVQPFQMIATIGRMDAQSIEGVARLNQVPAIAALEAMAQLAALHVRCRVEFERHAFLLKVVRCRGRFAKTLQGALRIRARLTGHSADAWRYATSARGAGGDAVEGQLLIGVRDYDVRFQKRHLKDYYRKVVNELMCGPH